jgi:hypothetical protein
MADFDAESSLDSFGAPPPQQPAALAYAVEKGDALELLHAQLLSVKPTDAALLQLTQRLVIAGARQPPRARHHRRPLCGCPLRAA